MESCIMIDTIQEYCIVIISVGLILLLVTLLIILHIETLGKKVYLPWTVSTCSLFLAVRERFHIKTVEKNEYFIVIISLVIILLLVTLLFILQMLCCKKESKNNGKYSEVSQVEDEEVEEIIIQDEEKKKVPKSLDVDREIQNVCSTIEGSQYFSKVGDRRSSNDVSPIPPACDDNISINSVDSNGPSNRGGGFFISNNHYSMNPNVQASIIYEKEKKYVAGKIIQVTGLMFDEKYSPLHIRVHVVVFPVKKYAIKTNWYEIRKDGKIKMDEYFKFVFKQIPSDKRGRIRIRAYVQSTALGMLGKPECIGESYVNLIEILTAGGGKTIWRPLSRDVSSQTIPEE